MTLIKRSLVFAAALSTLALVTALGGGDGDGDDDPGVGPDHRRDHRRAELSPPRAAAC